MWARNPALYILAFLAAAMFLLAGCERLREDPEPRLDPVQEREEAPEEKEDPETRVDEDEEEIEEYEVVDDPDRELREDPEEVKPEEDELEILRERIHFAFDRSELSGEAQDILQEKARVLQENPELEIVIEGHCDERGTAEYNMALGERRARAAYEYLVLLGVEVDRMSKVSYGEERPLVEGEGEAVWSQNRRAEFRVRD